MADTFIDSAAFSASSDDLQIIEAHASGDATEYVAYSNIDKWSPTLIARAPPDPPSPVTTTMIGVFNSDIMARFCAIASLCPLSSPSIPG